MDESSSNRQESAGHEADFVVLCELDDLMLLGLFKSVLEAAGVPHVVQGEQALATLPYTGLVPVAGVNMAAPGATIYVQEGRLEEARELLKGSTPEDSGDV